MKTSNNFLNRAVAATVDSAGTEQRSNGNELVKLAARSRNTKPVVMSPSKVPGYARSPSYFPRRTGVRVDSQIETQLSPSQVPSSLALPDQIPSSYDSPQPENIISSFPNVSSVPPSPPVSPQYKLIKSKSSGGLPTGVVVDMSPHSEKRSLDQNLSLHSEVVRSSLSPLKAQSNPPDDDIIELSPDRDSENSYPSLQLEPPSEPTVQPSPKMTCLPAPQILECSRESSPVIGGELAEEIDTGALSGSGDSSEEIGADPFETPNSPPDNDTNHQDRHESSISEGSDVELIISPSPVISAKPPSAPSSQPIPTAVEDSLLLIETQDNDDQIIPEASDENHSVGPLVPSEAVSPPHKREVTPKETGTKDDVTPAVRASWILFKRLLSYPEKWAWPSCW